MTVIARGICKVCGLRVRLERRKDKQIWTHKEYVPYPHHKVEQIEVTTEEVK